MTTRIKATPAPIPRDEALAAMGQRLLRLRVAAGKMEKPPKRYTQTAFSKRAKLTQGAYANYEIGARQPEIGALAKLTHEFDITTDWLLLGKPDHLPYQLVTALDGVTEDELQAAKKKKR